MQKPVTARNEFSLARHNPRVRDDDGNDEKSKKAQNKKEN
jgi:hypothetical protein